MLDVKTERTGVGNLIIKETDYRNNDKDIYVLADLADDNSIYIMGWAWKSDFDSITPESGRYGGYIRVITAENLRDMDTLAKILTLEPHADNTTLAEINPEILAIISSTCDDIVMNSESTIALVHHQRRTLNVEISSVDFDDDAAFYHFYLGHRIDCIEEINTPEGHDILVYPECSDEMAQLILSAVFEGQLIETQLAGEQGASFVNIVDDFFAL